MTGQRQDPDSRGGIAFGLAAYGLWGLMPLFFYLLRRVPPAEILGQRIVWCGLLLAGVLTLTRRWGELARCLRSPRTLGVLTVTTLLIALNWFAYIYGVNTGRTVQTSLGYFINPLLNVVLGMAFFRERLRRGQAVALAIACVGLAVLLSTATELPWIAFTVATSFALYGLFRKTIPAVDGIIGLTAESLLLSPLALAFLAYLGATTGLSLGAFDRTTDALLIATGVVTAVPLICFAEAARRLRLATLGFLQYIAPSTQFLLAVTVLGEPISGTQILSFACIWAALLVYTLDSLRAYRTIGNRRPPVEPIELAECGS
jgi:chloramphenicol-sensitive protein RarD